MLNLEYLFLNILLDLFQINIKNYDFCYNFEKLHNIRMIWDVRHISIYCSACRGLQNLDDFTKYELFSQEMSSQIDFNPTGNLAF